MAGAAWREISAYLWRIRCTKYLREKQFDVTAVRLLRLTAALAAQRTSELTEGAAELFKVDEAVLVLVYQAEDPEGEGALGGAESPGLQQGEEHAKLLETQLVLLQIGQAGVMMEQSRALHCPVAAAEMLPLKIENKG